MHLLVLICLSPCSFVGISSSSHCCMLPSRPASHRKATLLRMWNLLPIVCSPGRVFVVAAAAAAPPAVVAAASGAAKRPMAISARKRPSGTVGLMALGYSRRIGGIRVLRVRRISADVFSNSASWPAGSTAPGRTDTASKGRLPGAGAFSELVISARASSTSPLTRPKRDVAKLGLVVAPSPETQTKRKGASGGGGEGSLGSSAGMRWKASAAASEKVFVMLMYSLRDG